MLPLKRRRQLVVADLDADNADRDLSSVTTDSVEAYRYYVEGLQFHEDGIAAEAAKYFERAIAVDSDFAMALAKLSVSYGNMGDSDRSNKYIQEAYRHIERLSERERYYIEGLYYTRNGEDPEQAIAAYRKAISSYQEALVLNPKLYKAHYRTAVLHEKLDEPEQADVQYRKTIELKPTFSPAFVNLGNMYIDYGFANVAMVVLQTGTQVNDTDARMWNGLGRAHLSLNQPKEAVDAFTKAKAIDPDMVDVLFGLGMAYAEMRKRKEAVENLNLFLQKASSDTPPDRVKAARDTVARMEDVI